MPTESAPSPCHVCGHASSEVFLATPPYAIMACTRCGLRYLWPQPSAEELNDLYDGSYFANADSAARGYGGYLADAENLRATFRDRLRLLPPTEPNARLLDIGAAAGFFVEQARTIGWAAEGIEPSAEMVRHAKDVLSVPVQQGTLETVDFGTRTFHTVTMWEVIEHLPHPRSYLHHIRRLLVPGGYLALSTPDAGSLAARVAGRRWLGWKKVPEHCFFFDRAALERLLDEAGFDIVETRYVSITVTWRFALARLADLVGMPWLARPPAWLATRPVRINPFYDLFVLARARPTTIPHPHG